MDNLPPMILKRTGQTLQYLDLETQLETQDVQQDCKNPSDDSSSETKIADKTPYNFSKITAGEMANGICTFKIDELISWVFKDGTVTVKRFDDEKNVMAMKEFKSDKTDDENVRTLFRFYLNRKVTRITTLEVGRLSECSLIDHFLDVENVILDTHHGHFELYKYISVFCHLTLRDISEEQSKTYRISKTKTIDVGSPDLKRLEYCLNLRTYTLKINAPPVSEDQLIHFLKEFKKIWLYIPLDIQIRNWPNLDRIIAHFSTLPGWETKFLYQKACASILHEHYEVTVYNEKDCLHFEVMMMGLAKDTFPEKLRLSQQPIVNIVQFLPYEVREKVYDAQPLSSLAMNTPHLEANKLKLYCDGGVVRSAKMDGRKLVSMPYLAASLESNHSIKKLKFVGVLSNASSFFKNGTIVAEHLILDSEKSYPEDFTQIFAVGYPKKITANCRETVKNLGELIKNVEVRFENEEPAVKKIRMEDD